MNPMYQVYKKTLFRAYQDVFKFGFVEVFSYLKTFLICPLLFSLIFTTPATTSPLVPLRFNAQQLAAVKTVTAFSIAPPQGASSLFLKLVKKKTHNKTEKFDVSL